MFSTSFKSAIKDVLLLFFGTVIGAILQSSQNPLSYLLIIPIGFLVLVLITEITDSPLLKFYNSQLIFKDSRTAENAWLKIENDIGDLLSYLIRDYKKTFFRHVLLRNQSEDKKIVFASFNRNLLKTVFGYTVKKLYKKASQAKEIETDVSALKKLFLLEKNSWYSLVPETVAMKYLFVRKIYLSLLNAGEVKSKEIFDVLINRIKSIPGFKYERAGNDHFFSATDKRFSGAYIACELKGSDIIIEDFYTEVEGVESSTNYEPVGRLKINTRLWEKLDELKKIIKKGNNECKIKIDTARAWVCKEQDKRIISIKLNQYRE